MQWRQVLSDAGLSDREVNAVMVLSTKSSLKASELAKELGTTRLDAYNSLERLQSIGLVKTIADRPMRFSSMNVLPMYCPCVCVLSIPSLQQFKTKPKA